MVRKQFNFKDIQLNPSNWNFQGKSKMVSVIWGSSYRVIEGQISNKITWRELKKVRAIEGKISKNKAWRGIEKGLSY